MKIKELQILTANLTEQIKFYTQKIGLELIEQSNVKAKFRIGNTHFILTQHKDAQPYHFAINIPCNQEEEALIWLKSRVDILKDGQHEIQDFDFWNAKAIYFYDIDQNIVEFIARKNLNNKSEKQFSAKSLLEISEIGVPVNDIKTTYNSLNKIVTLPVFDGGFERFCAIGDENGLFICINKRERLWFPTNDKAYSSEFEILLTENNNDYKLEFKNGELKEGR